MKKIVQRCMSRKIRKVMHEYKRHKLSMSGGQKVLKRKQAIAIGLSMAREKCFKK